MSDPSDLPLFGGIPALEPTLAKPRRASKPKGPTPAQRAADVRREGARRLRASQRPGQRTRVGQPRDLGPAPVLAFPLARNANVLSTTVDSLPHFHDETFEKNWVKVGRNIEQRLIRRGLTPADALNCAHELLDAALDVRATQAENERRRG